MYANARTSPPGSIHALQMLHEFLTARRGELIERCRVKVAKRSVPKEIESERACGIPIFIDQLVETLQAEPERSKEISGAADGAIKSTVSEMGVTAARH